MPAEHAVVAQASLEVVAAGPIGQRGGGRVIERAGVLAVEDAGRGETALDFTDHFGRRLERFIGTDQHRRVPHGEQPRELGRRLGMVVDAQGDVAVVAAFAPARLTHDQERGRLFPSAVATGGIAGEQRRQEPVAQVAVGVREGLGERRDDIFTRQDVPLYGEGVAGAPARPLHAVGAGERGRTAVRVDEADLALFAIAVRLEDRVERGVRGQTARHQSHALGTEVGVRPRLRGDGSDTRLRPWHHRADARELRRDGHAEVAGRFVERDDGERHRRPDRSSWNAVRYRSRCSSMWPAPRTTVSRGDSATCTGPSHSCDSSRSRPVSKAPPPMRNMPVSSTSWVSSGGASASVRRAASTIRLMGSAIACRTSTSSSRTSTVLPDESSRPTTNAAFPLPIGNAEPTARLTSSAARSPIATPYVSRTWSWIATSRSNPPTPTVCPDTMPPIETTAISERAPPMSTMRLPIGSWIGSPAPIAAASGSPTSVTCFAPLISTASSSARRSTGELSDAIVISTRGFGYRPGAARRITTSSRRCVISNSVKVPSRSGRTPTTPPEPLPMMRQASSPTATTRSESASSATTVASSNTIPSPSR